MTHNRTLSTMRTIACKRLSWFALAATVAAMVMSLNACSGDRTQVTANGPMITVGVTKVVKKSLGRQITLSSELVPFQEIDVYAKESGYVKKLMVDYGTRVKAGEVMALLEIPELEAQLQEDQAQIKNAANQAARAQHELERDQAQYNALHLQYTRLNGVFQSQPGIVAQQEVDDAQGKDLAASSQVDAGQASLEAAQSQLSVTRAKLSHDQSLFDYSRITAPFPGVVTERYANLGTLVQAGTGSSTQAIPIVEALTGRFIPARHPGSGGLRPIHQGRRSRGRSRALAQQDIPRQGGAVFRRCAGGYADDAYGG